MIANRPNQHWDIRNVRAFRTEDQRERWLALMKLDPDPHHLQTVNNEWLYIFNPDDPLTIGDTNTDLR